MAGPPHIVSDCRGESRPGGKHVNETPVWRFDLKEVVMDFTIFLAMSLIASGGDVKIPL
jgi:hypothetical protein